MADDQLIQQAERAKPTAELGAEGLLSFAGYIEEAYLPELRYPAAYAKFNEMRRRNPTIASMLNAIALLARSASWSVEPAGTSDADQRAAEFLEQCLADMSTTIEDVVEDLLTAIPFGWAWSEIVYKRRQGTRGESSSHYDDNLIGWRKFAPRRQGTFYKWEADDAGGIRGLWQMLASDLKQSQRFLPIEKSIHFTAQRDQGNPEGMSILEPAYEAWHFIKNLQIINGIGFERAFVGLPKFTYGTLENPYTPTDGDIATVRAMGRGLRVDEKAFVALPGQIGFELITTTNTGADAIMNTIKQYTIWILQIVLADFIALGTTSSGGSYSLGADKSVLFLMAIDGWLDRIAHPDKLGVLNRYAVPRLFGYNNFAGITDFPRIKHSSAQKPDLGALASYLQSLTTYIKPDLVLEAELRKLANLPPPLTQPETLQPNQDPNAPPSNAPIDPTRAMPGNEPSGNGPETGANEGGISAEMSVPHPPARGQKYYFLSQWQELRRKFEAAMKEQ